MLSILDAPLPIWPDYYSRNASPVTAQSIERRFGEVIARI